MRRCRHAGGLLAAFAWSAAAQAAWVSPVAAQAHDYVSASTAWRFELGTFIWAPAVGGDVVVDGTRIPISADVPDIIREADFLFAFNLFFLARKDRWGVQTRAQYMQFGADSRDELALKVDARAVIVEVSGTYAFLQGSFGSAFRNLVAVDAVVGARFWWLGVDVKAVDGAVTASGSQPWIDPLAGMALRFDLMDGRVPIRLWADVGGFGAGSSVAWGAAASIGYRWFRRRLDIALALSYRALRPNYTSPSGDFGFEAGLHGPAIALDFGF